MHTIFLNNNCHRFFGSVTINIHSIGVYGQINNINNIHIIGVWIYIKLSEENGMVNIFIDDHFDGGRWFFIFLTRFSYVTRFLFLFLLSFFVGLTLIANIYPFILAIFYTNYLRLGIHLSFLRITI
ncbi:hypothetical protein ACJX0J_007372 [Zea mays]